MNKIFYENNYSWQFPPKSASFHTPKWFKDMKPDDTSSVKTLPHYLTVKSCVPFIDALTSGYMLELPVDVAVKKVNGFINLTWSKGDLRIAEARGGEGAPLLPVPTGYDKQHFVWFSMVSFEISKGYSMLITHPFNRFDLPFVTLSGIADADSVLGPGQIPFFIKEGFEGVIQAGTPIAQLLPFKRENWQLKEQVGLWQKGADKNTRAINFSRGFYKKNHWSKKTYE